MFHVKHSGDSEPCFHRSDANPLSAAGLPARKISTKQPDGLVFSQTTCSSSLWTVLPVAVSDRQDATEVRGHLAPWPFNVTAV